MYKRIEVILFTLFLMPALAVAQNTWSKEDAQWLKNYLEGKAGVKEDKEMNHLIKEVFEGQKPLQPDSRPFLDFVRDLPSEYTVDSCRIRRSLSLQPYTLFTKWNEDPIYDKFEDYRLYKNFVKNMANIFNPRNNVSMEKVDPSPVFAKRTQGAMMVGVSASVSFSLDDILFHNFTRLGRLIRHNRKVRDEIIRKLQAIPTITEPKRLATRSVSKDTTRVVSQARRD